MTRTVALASSVSIVSLLLSGAAMAQSGDRSLDEIVVTATKIATDVQDVPIAITAVTADMLEDRQVKTTADLGNIVPNATFRKSEGIYGAGVSATLRGIGQTDTQFSREPAVAMYIDDVYYPFLFGSNFDLLDLDHVEVLRGPQGTLFGRNAISGAINMVSKTPSLTEPSGYAEATVGSYDRRDFRAGFSVPLTDRLATSVSVVSTARKGYMKMLDFSCQMYKNGTPELAGSFPFQSAGTTFAAGREPKDCVIGHLGGQDHRGIRGALHWEPASNIRIDISGDYSEQHDENAAEKVFETDYASTYGLQPDGTVDKSKANPNFTSMADQFSIPGTPFRWDERFETGDMYTTYDNYCDPFPAGTQLPNNSYYNGSLYRGGLCWGNEVPLTSWGLQGKAAVGLTDHIEATLIGGYRSMKTLFGAAWDGTIFNDSLIYHQDETWNWNGEFRLTGQYDHIDWVGGIFYYKGDAQETGQPQNTRNGTQQFHNVHYFPKAKAAYLNVTWRPIDRLSLNGGIRRSDDNKFVDYEALFEGSAPGSTTFTAAGTSTAFTLDIKNKRWDWKLGADYDLSDHSMVYVSAATGYRLPSFNTRVFQKGQAVQNSEEALINYEIGTKADFFDRRLRINAAAFMLRFSKRPASFGGQEPRFAPDGVSILPGDQTLIPDGPDNSAYSEAFTNCRDYVPSDGAPNGSTVGITCISRTFPYGVSGSKIKGLEAEITAEPIDGLRINGSVGYTKRPSDTGRPVGFPDWTASGGIQYLIQADALNGTIVPRLDWFFNSNIAYSTDYPQYDEGSRSTFNGRVSYSNTEYDFDVALGVTNLFDKQYYRQKTIFTVIGAPANIGQPAPPREWYLTVKKRF